MALSNYKEMETDRVVPTFPEVRSLLPRSGEIFVRDPFISQAFHMGETSGVEVTLEVANLYKKFSDKPLDGNPVESDQVLLARALEQTGGPVEVFKKSQAYSHIFKRN